MDAAMIMDNLWPLTLWHWLALAALLFAIEMMLGTFDLLMVALAALMTAVWATFAPAGIAGWEAQLLVFFVASVVLITLGRTVLSGLRTGGPGEPALNKRMDRMLGERGVVVSDFSAGQGRVKIGDTEWLAESTTGTNLLGGTAVIVEGSRSTVVLVRAA